MNGYRYMTLEDRQKIEHWIAEQVPLAAIADRLGVHLSTVYREMRRGCTDGTTYSASRAQEIVEKSLRRKGRRKTQPPRDGGRKAAS